MWVYVCVHLLLIHSYWLVMSFSDIYRCVYIYIHIYISMSFPHPCRQMIHSLYKLSTRAHFASPLIQAGLFYGYFCLESCLPYIRCLTRRPLASDPSTTGTHIPGLRFTTVGTPTPASSSTSATASKSSVCNNGQVSRRYS